MTLGSTAIRRRPNAFNLLHQMEVMARAGHGAEENLKAKLSGLCFETFSQAFEDAASIAQAYQIGRMESSAALNLLNHVSPATREKLKELVRPGGGFSPRRFVAY